jgi:tetratricopeptide (TPR) repeat protein
MNHRRRYAPPGCGIYFIALLMLPVAVTAVVQVTLQSLFKPVQVERDVKTKPGIDAELERAKYHAQDGPFQDKDKALAEYEAIIQNYPQSKGVANAYSGAAEAYSATSEYDKSMPMWKKAIELQPKSGFEKNLEKDGCSRKQGKTRLHNTRALMRILTSRT